MENFSSWESQQKYIEIVSHLNETRKTEQGRQPSFFVRTFGCQQNLSDGEKISGMLLLMGYLPAHSPEAADVVIYNSCAVRENAEDRIFGNVGMLKAARERNPDMIIGLCGCMVQQKHIEEKIKKSYPYVNLVFGTHALPLLPKLIYERYTTRKRIFNTSETEQITEDIPVRRDTQVKAWLPIMYGCDNFCTYCVVPLVRGRERSREPKRILDEVQELVSQGYREITLLGQNVNSYGKGLEHSVNFAELLKIICEIEGDFWIRFMTSHPKDCTKELIDVIAENPKICKHIHLPVQSGSDRILSHMNRHYTREQYLDLIDYARSTIPDVTFTSDIIVGFPGEREEDFEDTISLVKQVKYQSLFTFLYSKREGTKAALMADTTTEQEKSQRFQQLLDVQNQIGQRIYQQYIGRTIKVIAEAYGKTGEGYLAGRSESNIIVEFKAPKQKIGKFVMVKITQAKSWALLGEITIEEL